MVIRLFLLGCLMYFNSLSTSCPYVRTSVILTDCVFDTRAYLSLGAHISHSKSINFLGHYSLHNQTNRSNQSVHHTLIYNLGYRWMLLLPLILKCSHPSINLTFTECQYTMRQNQHHSRSSSIAEYMTAQLTVMNISHLGMKPVLFLPPGLHSFV
jgi:hypothetical protein